MRVKIYNKTGYDVDSLIVGTTFVGNLAKDNATDFLNFQECNFDSGIPNDILKYNIENQNLIQRNWSFCGSHYKTINSGIHLFDLTLLEQANDNYLLKLENHQ